MTAGRLPEFWRLTDSESDELVETAIGSPSLQFTKAARSTSPLALANSVVMVTVLRAGTVILYQSVSPTLTIRPLSRPALTLRAFLQVSFCSELSSDPAFRKFLILG